MCYGNAIGFWYILSCLWTPLSGELMVESGSYNTLQRFHVSPTSPPYNHQIFSEPQLVIGLLTVLLELHIQPSSIAPCTVPSYSDTRCICCTPAPLQPNLRRILPDMPNRLPCKRAEEWASKMRQEAKGSSGTRLL
jgi:hypothetical protein